MPWIKSKIRIRPIQPKDCKKGILARNTRDKNHYTLVSTEIFRNNLIDSIGNFEGIHLDFYIDDKWDNPSIGNYFLDPDNMALGVAQIKDPIHRDNIISMHRNESFDSEFKLCLGSTQFNTQFYPSKGFLDSFIFKSGIDEVFIRIQQRSDGLYIPELGNKGNLVIKPYQTSWNKEELRRHFTKFANKHQSILDMGDMQSIVKFIDEL